MRLVATGLSTPAYVTVATVMGLEAVLDQAEGFRVLFDRERGRDSGMHYLRVFGEPGGTGARAGGPAATTCRSTTSSSTASSSAHDAVLARR